jgi:hypothetical protein
LAAVVDRIRNGWSKLGASWRLACTVAFLLFVTMLLGAVLAQTPGGDGDGDGMSDAYPIADCESSGLLAVNNC